MENRKNMAIFCAFFVLLGIIVAVITLTLPRESEVSYVSAAPSYIVKLTDGYLTVYNAENLNTPIKRTDIPEFTLRKYDRELLAHGIHVAGEYELMLLLEDFGS